ncbi:MAG: diguanylate cyclase/phosphodiesterase (GGDEF & EAL domains) with PAS/PAC sensor(s) [uncultured Solirubrobacteraceae bacterium]|uniref:Diguanylate cyclase/phosphodiesterase (GGDEF & EAL domains) with PAS/PAC sensor(S) n=1 Tax=uncultured Solirubrobacteraceae bacterium TaxID=1162706 RepID=A0A6J4RVN4_9ACTN|nr:MAG: diguanylate cyclase/phosphodiesterase (GGDEF & EAL domains) with PAS/PAC sensor(s) [uncultured Solirubrobacteraceae bacterium]
MSRFRGDAALTGHATLRQAAAGPRTRLAALDRLGEAVVVFRPDGRPAYANVAARELAKALGFAVEADAVRSLEEAVVDAGGRVLPAARRPSEITRLTGRSCDREPITVAAPDGAPHRVLTTTRRTTDEGPPYGVVASYALEPAAPDGGPARNGSTASSGHAVAPAPGGSGPDDGRALRHARELFTTAFHQAPIGMALLDTEGRWLLVNQALCDLVGYSETELLQRTLHDITHPEDLPGQLVLMREILAGRRSSYQLDKRYMHADGHVIWGSVSVSVVRDDSGAALHLIGQVVDITDRHHGEQRLQHLADHDPLTGVLNRRRFEEELIRQLDRCRRYQEHATLVMIDLDFFKDVNDSLGHAAGDETLQSIAAALLGHVRSSDILARVGGDEFAAILVGVGSERASVAAAGLATVVREIDSAPTAITASVGATVLRSDDQADVALLRADEALYEVKRQGRDGSSVAPAPSSPPPA